MAAAGGRQVLSDGGGLHTLLSLRQQAASSTATKAPRLLSFVHRPPTRRGGSGAPGAAGRLRRRCAAGRRRRWVKAPRRGPERYRVRVRLGRGGGQRLFYDLSRNRRNRRPGAVGSATDGRRRRRLHPGACGGVACSACGANRRGLLRWKRPVAQDPAGGFVSAAADRHALPAGPRAGVGVVVGDAPHDLETGPRDLTGN